MARQQETRSASGRAVRRALEWLFGAEAAPEAELGGPLAEPVPALSPARAAPAVSAESLTAGGPPGAEGVAVPAAGDVPAADGPGRRTMFRTKVDLPADMEIAGKDVSVRIENLSGTGAAIIYHSIEPVPESGLWLDLALPNRPKPLELELRLVHTRRFTDAKGEMEQMLHVAFPSIRLGEQDNIIAYLNNIRLYEGKQYAVAATVKMEVVTGRRRFAKFVGQTMEIRPDKMKLMMDDFDAIAGSEVMLTVMAPHFADHIDVDAVKVEKVDIVSPRKAEVDVTIAKPNDNVLLFIRKYYPSSSKARRA
ncbi:MAG: PilZ domain-containing protein [Chloroflexota bacterium]